MTLQGKKKHHKAHHVFKIQELLPVEKLGHI